MAILKMKLDPKQPGSLRCEMCRKFFVGVAPNATHCYQIRNGNGIEPEAYCSKECARMLMKERGRKVRHCHLCSKAIPKRIRELYPHATFCSGVCTEEYNAAEDAGFTWPIKPVDTQANLSHRPLCRCSACKYQRDLSGKKE